MSFGIFNEKISKEIFTAFQKSMTKYRIVCQKSDGTIHRDGLQLCDPKGLRKLADALNLRFPSRRYFVEKVECYKYPDLSKKVG